MERSPVTGEGCREAESWLAGSDGQKVAVAVNAEAAKMGSTVLGVSSDHDRQKILVVLDPAAPGKERAAAETTFAAAGYGSIVEVRVGCRSLSVLKPVIDALSSNDFAATAGAAYAFGLEPTTGTIRIGTDSADFARRVSKQYGELVEVDVTPRIGAHSRLADASPHYGAARITDFVHDCTSNFTYVSNVYFTRIMATAGHCFPDDALIYSGGNLVGEVVYRSVPNPDVAMLYSAGQSYTNRIYTDPGSPSNRSVVGKISPGVNTYVCTSGSFTFAKCGAQVINTNEYYCDPDGCRYNLTQTFNFDQFCRPGDSGGPWYVKSGSSNALAAGLHWGGFTAFGGWSCLFHKISTVESTLNATLLTTP